jgi:hypothetical protein
MICFGAVGTADVKSDCHSALHCVNETAGALVRKTAAGMQIQSRPASGSSPSANVDVGDYDNCLYVFDSFNRSLRCEVVHVGLRTHPSYIDPWFLRQWFPTRNMVWSAHAGRLESSAAVVADAAT